MLLLGWETEERLMRNIEVSRRERPMVCWWSLLFFLSNFRSSWQHPDAFVRTDQPFLRFCILESRLTLLLLPVVCSKLWQQTAFERKQGTSSPIKTLVRNYDIQCMRTLANNKAFEVPQVLARLIFFVASDLFSVVRHFEWLWGRTRGDLTAESVSKRTLTTQSFILKNNYDHDVTRTVLANRRTR